MPVDPDDVVCDKVDPMPARGHSGHCAFAERWNDDAFPL